jgi:DNA-directed RNA polymerase beta' subunit
LNESEERKVLLNELQEKVRSIQASNLPDKDKMNKIAMLSGQYSKQIWDSNLKYMVGKGSTAGLMAMTGARGNPMQLGQGTSSPVMSQDLQGNPIPIVIQHSFAEGLTPAEHLAMSYGGRASTVKTQLSTSKPGALSKEITPNVFHEVITEHDCGTKNGLFYPLTDKKAVIDKIEVGDTHPIDETKYKELVLSGKTKVQLPLLKHVRRKRDYVNFAMAETLTGTYHI